VGDAGGRDGPRPRLHRLRPSGPSRARGHRARGMGASAALIEVHDLTRTFGGVRALDGVTLAVRAGERRAVIGPNGAGKTTLFNVLTGELSPTAGSVRLAGRCTTRSTTWQRARWGLARMYQRNELVAPLSARGTVAPAVASRRGPYLRFGASGS